MHIGSWGLPELGITEWIGKKIAKISGGYAPLTSQLGSNLFGIGVGTAYAQEPTTGTIYPTAYTLPTQTTSERQTQPTSQPVSQPTQQTSRPQQTASPSEQDRARQILREMDEGKITWDDNLRAWAHKVLESSSGPSPVVHHQKSWHYNGQESDLAPPISLFTAILINWQAICQNGNLKKNKN